MATFQELSDIANNAGQPELVYKLMELSTASAMWNTRKGVAFALAGQSRAKLEAHLSELLPTLYRYTFDPNPRISQAMKQVWSALVPDPKRALSSHLPAVLAHLLEGITSREWRAREASCLALADVLSGRTYDELATELTDMHVRLLRAVDDIKESVRKVALSAWRALSSVLNRLCDGTLASAVRAPPRLPRRHTTPRPPHPALSSTPGSSSGGEDTPHPRPPRPPPPTPSNTLSPPLSTL